MAAEVWKVSGSIYDGMYGAIRWHNAPEEEVLGTVAHIPESPLAADRARRILAMHNACEGIPTAALEAGVVADLVEIAKATIATWEKSAEYGTWRDAVELARSTLAKLKEPDDADA